MSLAKPNLEQSKARADAVYNPGFAYTLLGGVILVWGSNWPVMKLGLTFMTPLWFAAVRTMMGAAALFLVVLIRGRFRLPPRRDLSVFLSVSLLQMTALPCLVNYALLHVEAGRAAILAFCTPLWVTPAARVVLGESLTVRKVLGLGLGLGGVAVLFNPLGFDWTQTDVVLGNGLLIIGSFVWAAAILHVRSHRWVSSPLQLTPWQLLLAGLVLILLTWRFEEPTGIHWSWEMGAILAYSGFLSTGFGFWAALGVNRALPAILASLGFLGVPVVGVLSSAVSLHEPLTPTLIGGLVLIVGGVAMVSLPRLAPRG